MVVIGCAGERDAVWLEKLIRRRGLCARLAEGGERWDVFVDRRGSVHGGGQVITCGLDRRCTLTPSSLLQEGGLAALQREMHTLSGRTLQPREVSLERLSGGGLQRLTACALLLLLGEEP